MKNPNIKEYILFISFTFIFIVLFLSLNVLITKKTYVEIVTNQKTKNDFAILETKINDLKDNECKNSLNKLFLENKKTNFDGKIKLSDFYNILSESRLISHYEEIKDNCNISINKIEEYDISNKYLSKMVLYDKLLFDYLYQYELKFNDEASKEHISSITQVVYKSIKYSEIELLNDYLKIIGDN